LKENQSKIRQGLSFGFYWRKFFFFGLVFTCAIFVLQSFTSVKADSGDFDSAIYSNDPKSDITITKAGKIIIAGRTTQKISILKDFDEYRSPVLDAPGIYLEEFTVILHLPENSDASKVKYEFLGIHGVERTESFVQDSHTIVYKAYNVGPSATLSVIAKLPKGIITYSLTDNMLYSLRQYNVQQWALLSLVVPLLLSVFFIIYISRQIRQEKMTVTGKETNAPPMALPPAVVGVLFRQRVTAREFASTLVDLAMRGNIYILDKERDFVFAKNKLDKRLLPYEKILLSKIFKEKIFSSQEDIEKRINDHLYSRKISLFTSGIYTLATRLGYFKVNPQSIHVKYRLGGLLGFFASLAGFLLSFKYLDYQYLSFFWIGLMLSALFIISISSKIPIRTKAGLEALNGWLSFRKFLSNKEKVAFSYDNQEMFEKYLPYAIALDCEIAWAKRFSDQNFMIPAWFVSGKSGFGLQDFCLSLFPIISYLARSLSAIREPGFE
jgi:uncharacterized membrane protein